MMRLIYFYLSVILLSIQIGFAQGSGNALTFNGSTQYIDLGTTVAANCRTIEFWFSPAVLINNNMPDVVSFIARDFNNGSGLNTNEFGFYIPAGNWPSGQGHITFYRRIGSTAYSIISNANTWQANTWYHVAGVIDPTAGMQLYINGVLQSNTDPSTQAIQVQTGSTTDMIAIATWGYWGATTGNRFYNGDMDEVRFWTSARTQTQIRDNMCRKINPVQASLQGYYRFDTNSGTTLPDLTGNGYNGTLDNMSATPWHYSSAPIGDTSVNVYTSTWASQSLSLNYAPGDIFNISNVTANPDGAHIYRVASLPNVTTGLTSPLSDYYGVFLTGTSGFYDISEDFSAYTSSCSGSCLTLAARNNNAVLSWTAINPTINNCVLTKTNESSVGSPYRAEYILSVGGANVSVTSSDVSCNGGTDGKATANVSGGTAPYTYTWSPSGSNTSSITAGAGNYTVSVADAGGCSQSMSVAINQPSPITITTNSITVCNGQTATVTAQAAGGTAPYNYVWNGISVGQIYTNVPTANSIYTVTVTDANGCQSPFAVAFVTVQPPLQVSVGDASSCAGINTSLSAHATGGNGNYSFNWMPGNLTGNSISVSPQTTTVYTVTVSDGCSINNASDTGIVFITNTIPALTLPAASAGCPPLCMNFNVPYSGSEITAWLWNFGDNTTSATQNPYHCYTVSGNFNVSLSYSTAAGCSKTITGNDLVTVYSAPSANFSAASFELDVITPSIVFINQSQNATAYQWNFGDAQYSTGTNPSHQYPSTVENYSVSLVATNAQGCSDTVTHIVYVQDAFAFYAPNCFTPNADNLNEQFLPVGEGWNNAAFNMQVFDRWGSLIFKSDNAYIGWNGTFKGTGTTIVQEGVYVWKVELLDNKNKSHNYSGTITLLK